MPGNAATDKAPETMEALKALLKNDIKVKVAGTRYCCRACYMPDVIGPQYFLGIDGEILIMDSGSWNSCIIPHQLTVSYEASLW